MKSFGLAAYFLLASYALLGVVVFISWAYCPSPVAVHFDLHGRPNGWMTRGENGVLLVVLALGLPLLFCSLFRILYGRNIVSFNYGVGRRYVVRPEEMPRVRRAFLDLGIWLSIQAVLFMTGIQIVLLLSNIGSGNVSPNQTAFAVVLILFVFGNLLVTAWTLLFVRGLVKSGAAIEEIQ